jgi:hypothetical protein
VLACGAVNQYEADSLAPDTGETVPCIRHGYCRVIEVHRLGRAADRYRLGGAMAGDGRRPRRSVDDLLAHLTAAQSASFASLRRQGFTLRLITMAARGGQVRIDDARRRVDIARTDNLRRTIELPRNAEAR